MAKRKSDKWQEPKTIPMMAAIDMLAYFTSLIMGVLNLKPEDNHAFTNLTAWASQLAIQRYFGLNAKEIEEKVIARKEEK